MILARIGWRGAAYIALLAAAAVLIVVRWSALAAIWREHAITFAAVTLLMITALIVQARNFKSFLSATEGPPLIPMARIWALGVLANYLGPFQPGIAVRVALLTRAGVPVVESLVATAQQTFATLWLGLLVLAVSLTAYDPVPMAVPALGLLAVFVLTAKLLPLVRMLAARMLRHTRASGLAQHVERAIELPAPRAAAGVLAQYALTAAVFYLVYREFGVHVTVPAVLGLSCVVLASTLVALFPGNFGVLEALLTLFGSVSKLPVDQSLALAFLFRGAHVAGALLVAATFVRRSSRAAPAS